MHYTIDATPGLITTVKDGMHALILVHEAATHIEHILAGAPSFTGSVCGYILN